MAVAPTPPSGSSPAVPTGGFKKWFKDITDWIALLSPAGAADYDSGWVPCTSPNSAFTAANLHVRRIGKLVVVRGGIIPTTTSALTSAFVSVAQLPAGFAPDGQRYPVVGAVTVAAVPVFIINSGGLVEVRSFFGSPINVGTNTTLSFNASWTVA